MSFSLNYCLQNRICCTINIWEMYIIKSSFSGWIIWAEISRDRGKIESREARESRVAVFCRFNKQETAGNIWLFRSEKQFKVRLADRLAPGLVLFYFVSNFFFFWFWNVAKSLRVLLCFIYFFALLLLDEIITLRCALRMFYKYVEEKNVSV